MNLPDLIAALEACVADSEWERAETYLDDLQRAARDGGVPNPRIAGAITQTLSGIASAIEHHAGNVATAGLVHLAHLRSDRAH